MFIKFHTNIKPIRRHAGHNNHYSWICIFSSPEPLGSLVSLLFRHAPLSVRPPFSKIFFSKTAGPIKAKFHVEPQWDGGAKVCLRGLGHMTKMATTPIYGKNPAKIFFSRTKGPMTLWLSMWHWGLGPIIICSNDDPRLTLTYFTARSNLVSYAFIWGKLLESHLMEETYNKWPEWQKVYVYIKILTPRGCLPLPRGYIHV